MSLPAKSVVEPDAQPDDLSDNEKAVLAALREGVDTLDGLAQRCRLKKLHVARIFDALERRKLVVP